MVMLDVTIIDAAGMPVEAVQPHALDAQTTDDRMVTFVEVIQSDEADIPDVVFNAMKWAAFADDWESQADADFDTFLDADLQ